MQAIQQFIQKCDKFAKSLYSIFELSTQEAVLKELVQTHQQLLKNSEVTQFEKEFILSNWNYVGDVNMYNVPIYNSMADRLKLKFSHFYNISNLSESTLNHQILAQKVAPLFHLNYLSPTIGEQTKCKELQGIRFGTESKLLFSIPTTINQKTLNVIYMLDTTSPINKLSNEAILAFGTIDPPGSFHVEIGGIKSAALKTDVDGVNVIGDRFLRDSGALVELNYSDPVSCRIKIRDDVS